MLAGNFDDRPNGGRRFPSAIEAALFCRPQGATRAANLCWKICSLCSRAASIAAL
jgi:hypothetical protein